MKARKPVSKGARLVSFRVLFFRRVRPTVHHFSEQLPTKILSPMKLMTMPKVSMTQQNQARVSADCLVLSVRKKPTPPVQLFEMRSPKQRRQEHTLGPRFLAHRLATRTAICPFRHRHFRREFWPRY
jgi:hypothetical protein